MGVEPTMADLQSAALATWLRRRSVKLTLGLSADMVKRISPFVPIVANLTPPYWNVDAPSPLHPGFSPCR